MRLHLFFLNQFIVLQSVSLEIDGPSIASYRLASQFYKVNKDKNCSVIHTTCSQELPSSGLNIDPMLCLRMYVHCLSTRHPEQVDLLLPVVGSLQCEFCAELEVDSSLAEERAINETMFESDRKCFLTSTPTSQLVCPADSFLSSPGLVDEFSWASCIPGITTVLTGMFFGLAVIVVYFCFLCCSSVGSAPAPITCTTDPMTSQNRSTSPFRHERIGNHVIVQRRMVRDAIRQLVTLDKRMTRLCPRTEEAESAEFDDPDVVLISYKKQNAPDITDDNKEIDSASDDSDVSVMSCSQSHEYCIKGEASDPSPGSPSSKSSQEYLEESKCKTSLYEPREPADLSLSLLKKNELNCVSGQPNSTAQSDNDIIVTENEASFQERREKTNDVLLSLLSSYKREQCEFTHEDSGVISETGTTKEIKNWSDNEGVCGQLKRQASANVSPDDSGTSENVGEVLSDHNEHKVLRATEDSTIRFSDITDEDAESKFSIVRSDHTKFSPSYLSQNHNIKYSENNGRSSNSQQNASSCGSPELVFNDARRGANTEHSYASPNTELAYEIMTNTSSALHREEIANVDDADSFKPLKRVFAQECLVETMPGTPRSKVHDASCLSQNNSCSNDIFYNFDMPNDCSEEDIVSWAGTRSGSSTVKDRLVVKLDELVTRSKTNAMRANNECFSQGSALSGNTQFTCTFQDVYSVSTESHLQVNRNNSCCTMSCNSQCEQNAACEDLLASQPRDNMGQGSGDYFSHKYEMTGKNKIDASNGHEQDDELLAHTYTDFFEYVSGEGAMGGDRCLRSTPLTNTLDEFLVELNETLSSTPYDEKCSQEMCQCSSSYTYKVGTSTRDLSLSDDDSVNDSVLSMIGKTSDLCPSLEKSPSIPPYFSTAGYQLWDGVESKDKPKKCEEFHHKHATVCLEKSDNPERDKPSNDGKYTDTKGPEARKVKDVQKNEESTDNCDNLHLSCKICEDFRNSFTSSLNEDIEVFEALVTPSVNASPHIRKEAVQTTTEDGVAEGDKLRKSFCDFENISKANDVHAYAFNTCEIDKKNRTGEPEFAIEDNVSLNSVDNETPGISHRLHNNVGKALSPQVITEEYLMAVVSRFGALQGCKENMLLAENGEDLWNEPPSDLDKEGSATELIKGSPDLIRQSPLVVQDYSAADGRPITKSFSRIENIFKTGSTLGLGIISGNSKERDDDDGIYTKCRNNDSTKDQILESDFQMELKNRKQQSISAKTKIKNFVKRNTKRKLSTVLSSSKSHAVQKIKKIPSSKVNRNVLNKEANTVHRSQYQKSGINGRLTDTDTRKEERQGIKNKVLKVVRFLMPDKSVVKPEAYAPADDGDYSKYFGDDVEIEERKTPKERRFIRFYHPRYGFKCKFIHSGNKD